MTSPGSGPSSRVFTPILLITMAGATFSLVVFGVLASELISVFGISRQQIGYLVTATGVVGAASSPLVGPLADRFGARRATLATLAASALSLALLAIAPSYLLLLAAAAGTGLAQAGGNPSTNKLIAERVPAGARGMITGIKQSGVQVGVFLGGVGLPALTVAFGWRAAVMVFAAVPALFVVLAALLLGPDPPTDVRAEPTAPWRPSAFIVRLGVYGLLLGAGTSAISTYLALFGQEALGASVGLAGWAVGVMGASGIAARIWWGRIAERRIGPGRALEIIAVVAALTGAVLAMAPGMGIGALWVAAIGAGSSAVAWNAVGMLAIILFVPPEEAGRASGVVLAGFLLGIAVGAPILGAVVDALDDYRVAWWGTAAVFAIALVVIRGALPALESPPVRVRRRT